MQTIDPEKVLVVHESPTLSYKTRRNIIIVMSALIIGMLSTQSFLLWQQGRSIEKQAQRTAEDREFFSLVRQLILLGNTGDAAERQRILDQLRAQQARIDALSTSPTTAPKSVGSPPSSPSPPQTVSTAAAVTPRSSPPATATPQTTSPPATTTTTAGRTLSTPFPLPTIQLPLERRAAFTQRRQSQ